MAKFYIEPSPGYVIVKSLEEEKIGDMQASDTISSHDSAGIVVAVGDDWNYYVGTTVAIVTCPVKIGDKIIYQNIGTNAFRDFKTGDLLHFVRFHVDAMFNQVLGVIE